MTRKMQGFHVEITRLIRKKKQHGKMSMTNYFFCKKYIIGYVCRDDAGEAIE